MLKSNINMLPGKIECKNKNDLLIIYYGKNEHIP
jgi:hypothetical protein